MHNNSKICLRDYQTDIKSRLPKPSYDYFSAGSDEQLTLRQNEAAFTKIKLCPRVLVDMSSFSTKTKVLGHELSLPFGVAPLAMQKLIHPLGEVVLAKEALAQGTAYGLSMLSTTSTREIAQVNPSGLKIHQLYLLKNAEYTSKFIKLVEENGFHALAITVDTQRFGKRRVDKRNKFQPQVTLEVFKGFGIDILFDAPEDQPHRSFIRNIDDSITWDSIAQIRKMTSLKIILKGVVAPEDIEPAEKAGVDAIWISNHGGRQLDTSPATVEALPAIRHRMDEVKSKMELYVDGGIWEGSDIFKCLALGADFVFLGRGLAYSLIDGEKGVKNAFEILKKELKTTMMLSGTPNIASINSSYIIWQQPYSRL